MNGKSVVSAVKGLGLGMVAGAAVGAVGYSYVSRHKKSVKRNVSKALRNVSQLVDNVGDMF